MPNNCSRISDFNKVLMHNKLSKLIFLCLKAELIKHQSGEMKIVNKYVSMSGFLSVLNEKWPELQITKKIQ